LPAPVRLVPPAVRRAVLALTALLALLAIVAAPAGAAPWSAPEEVSVPGGSASWSKVGIDAAGNATAVWTRSDGIHLLAQAAERPVGGSWGAPTDVSAPIGNAESVTLAVDPAGDVIVAWKERMAGAEAIEVNYKPAGGSWEGPVAVEFGSAVAETPAVAIDAVGDAVVIWRQGVGGNHVIFAASKSAGGSWAKPDRDLEQRPQRRSAGRGDERERDRGSRLAVVLRSHVRGRIERAAARWQLER
jgi:hypothetical protein